MVTSSEVACRFAGDVGDLTAALADPVLLINRSGDLRWGNAAAEQLFDVTLADGVGHPSHGENVAGAVKRQRVGGVEALGGHDFGVNRRQAPIVRLKSVGPRFVRSGRVRKSHPFDDIAGEKPSAIGVGGAVELTLDRQPRAAVPT